MRNLLTFKNSSYYSKRRKQEPTIAGEAFQTLMDLCFDRADCFSLHRCGWEKAWDGGWSRLCGPSAWGNICPMRGFSAMTENSGRNATSIAPAGRPRPSFSSTGPISSTGR